MSLEVRPYYIFGVIEGRLSERSMRLEDKLSAFRAFNERDPRNPGSGEPYLRDEEEIGGLAKGLVGDHPDGRDLRITWEPPFSWKWADGRRALKTRELSEIEKKEFVGYVGKSLDSGIEGVGPGYSRD